MSATLDRVSRELLTRHPELAAGVLDGLEPDAAVRLFRDLEAAPAAGVVEHMSPDAAAQVLDAADDAEARRLLGATDFVRVARVGAQLSPERRERLFSLLSPDERGRVENALEYPEGSAGQLMDPKVTTLRGESTVAQAIERLRRAPARGLVELLIVDAQGRLTGTLPIAELLAADGSRRLEELAHPGSPQVGPLSTRDEVVELFRQRALYVLTVVDLEHRVIGVLRQDALLEAAEHAATDDLQQMVGADKDERALTTPAITVKSRLPWLLINLGTGFLAATVVGLFDATIARFTALAVLMPVVAGQAGNTGAQSLAVVSRGLALREIRLGHARRVLVKEGLAAAANGASIALVTALGTYVWSRNPGLTLVIAASMIGSMVIAALAGAAVPMVLTALKRDPATASSIILTTVTDVAGFSSFLGLATALSSLIASGPGP